MPSPSLNPGTRVSHAEFGEGVVVEAPRNGFVRVFFPTGERLIAGASLLLPMGRNEQVLKHVGYGESRARRVWLSIEAHAIPIMESAAALTAAKIDLLPHQVVLTHRLATMAPRRILIADEVGLGKTIETALILRELASRGEMRRALIVVPAGLVNNWHRELNEVFHLGFEVFGSEGDVTDRKSNAFAKHDLLIASVDTLKRPARLQRLIAAPPWDLVVFDEAHHLAAYKAGGKVRKTENYKLVEALKDRTRDLLLLSATPHQGDHFRFWMLAQLLNPTLFRNPEEMLEQRHRLNVVVIRRTKADACKPDGSPLFSRRFVHTESFTMSEEERQFYSLLRNYLVDGFALAKRQGNKGRGLGFVMAIFQKIAASSFAAVGRTLRRRLLMLTIHEAILRDEALDIDGRQGLLEEAKALIRMEYRLGDDPVSRGEVDRVLADLKVKLLKRISEEELEGAFDPYASESALVRAEDMAITAVNMALPEERVRIKTLLENFPKQRETKAEKLLYALRTLWEQNPAEKVVIFATYLGTVDLLGREIGAEFPEKGVVVLQGGDHGAKLAAERKFRLKDGPRVLVCTAAGREGINLQNAKILFNFDLPWNPMDVEQRIGRIHRYGQQHTAQVYNLVLSDTIEGKIFLMLDEKLLEIARTLGKVDDQGNIAEDFRSQILGQLSERLRYDQLYREALGDPELHRTRLELEEALSNAREARRVVFELFQDLEGFNLEDYKPYEDVSQGLERMIRFFEADLAERGQKLVKVSEDVWEVRTGDGTPGMRFTLSREVAKEREDIQLLGIDHPLFQAALSRWKGLPPNELGVSVRGGNEAPEVVSWWLIEAQSPEGAVMQRVLSLATDSQGHRLPVVERKGYETLYNSPAAPNLTFNQRLDLLKEHLEPMLQRDLHHKGIVEDQGSYSTKLVGWVESS